MLSLKGKPTYYFEPPEGTGGGGEEYGSFLLHEKLIKQAKEKRKKKITERKSNSQLIFKTLHFVQMYSTSFPIHMPFYIKFIYKLYEIISYC